MSKRLIDRAEVTITLKDFEALKTHKKVSEEKITTLVSLVKEQAKEISLARKFITFFARGLNPKNKKAIKALVNLKEYYPDIYADIFLPIENDDDSILNRKVTNE